MSERCRSNGSRDMAVSVKTFFSGQSSKFDFGAPPVFVFVFVCASLYLYLCLFICICDYLYLYLVMTTFWVRFIFDENPLLRLRMALHEYLGSAPDTGT